VPFTARYLVKKNKGNNMLKWLDKIPFALLLVLSVTLGLSPFKPEPHLVEKIRMLFQGQLVNPIDIFDLFLHGTAPVLLMIKLVRLYLKD
jgi:SPX domain protein involved in polyphosphate accumulation